jgi:hypothetical protein
MQTLDLTVLGNHVEPTLKLHAQDHSTHCFAPANKSRASWQTTLRKRYLRQLTNGYCIPKPGNAFPHMWVS